jgi:Sulfotransferase family
MQKRTVIFHYHLFKNAGTSVDRILKRNFGEAWVTAEFDSAGPTNTKAVEAWIAATPDAVAYSTHTAQGPQPQVEGVDIIPVLFLRDPISRIQSAYRFEKKQPVDTWGANLAKTHDLTGYVESRLARKGDRQCRNFQTARLAALVPGPGSEVDRALRALDLLHARGVIGLVDDFDASINRLFQRIQPVFPEFSWKSVKANVSDDSGDPISPELRRLLVAQNQADIAVLSIARQLIGA